MSSAIVDSRVRAAIEHYLLDLENSQQRNTGRNYLPKQEEWKISWTVIPKVWLVPVPQGQQLPGDLVDEGKLLLFMKEVVVSRPPRKGKRIKDEKERHLGSQEVKRAVKSAQDASRGVGTLRDVYAPAQIPDHTNVAWSERKEIACALRTQVDFLFGNHMLLGSGNRLPVELADCFPLDLPKEGLKVPRYTTKALVVVMNCGKTNQHGRMEYDSALRHRDPRSCLVGALAFWFFWRWQVERTERFPVFQRSEDWYDTKVLRRSAKEPQAQLSSQTAREWTFRFYQKAGIKVSKVSHAPRVAATQNADIAGVDEGQLGRRSCGEIRRAGRWNNGDQMTGCYLTSLPFEFMRAVADFDPEWSG
ncbi:hypothetical protein HIM_09955 [Hirsutella minnesotensis 3608]|uniref:Ndc10 domain-containing protein n=1 Tax=Hirsutella minnesotensis 3608 TaxID=1043627 RepID=A0A0F7ZKK9_9HYPO|nr:hypothetical protein HIM_09955 [Hirsutella minnesotensis 3608]